ncbi:hypothetical protein CAPTEDRAFT_155831 [Capitella teleta]|uniref:Glutamate-rich WD repeat-containing protein 1 n=1 Tax=Capitella teleta TaxID=283909 RepID=R7TDG9_CAPTE|nr:hypothetical protein CAPTEDRAFT_155831 [Capitella teleta]|eukprot:ELT91552.1 hypothetical protein CAPTEDRAFT_155831 [Capitella teleta]
MPVCNNEELVMDDSAYLMYHQAQTGAPCLSFDVIEDNLGDKREEFPLTAYIIAGTQAEKSHTNNLIVMKMSNLHKNNKKKDDDDDDDDESDSDDDEEMEKPELQTAPIKHQGCVNRVRATKVGSEYLAASWSETGKVHIWDLKKPIQALNDAEEMSKFSQKNSSPSPLFTFSGHQVEGFAVDWCKSNPGWLATGDCSKNIHIWRGPEAGSWTVDQRPFIGHTASVEDIQWSPNEPNVLASCSVDKSIRIWDARAPPHKACMLTCADAHLRDINVISWNKHEPFIVSGGDDGMIKIWDLRNFQEASPVAVFKHHTAPITSVEWHPTDSSVLAASGSDDQITLWDLAVERDPDAEGGSQEEEPEVPPQLLFIHQGQTDLKEVHWHPQLPGVLISTAHSGFNIFRTISV